MSLHVPIHIPRDVPESGGTEPPQRRRQTRRRLRPVLVATASAAALILGAGTAAAHVSVSPGTVAPGSFPTLTFRVPTESATAATTKVEISIPTDSPFAFTMVGEKPGWTIEVIKSKLPAPVTQGTFTFDEAVSSIIFTSTGAGVPSDQFVTFDVLVGPVPDVPAVTFSATQTYSDGSVVTWDEPTPASGEEPEHPAPTLLVAGAAEADHDHGATTAADMTTGQLTVIANGDAAPASGSSGGSDGLARILAILGLLVGFIGVGMALRDPRRHTPSVAATGIPFPGTQVPADPPQPATPAPGTETNR